MATVGVESNATRHRLRQHTACSWRHVKRAAADDMLRPDARKTGRRQGRIPTRQPINRLRVRRDIVRQTMSPVINISLCARVYAPSLVLRQNIAASGCGGSRRRGGGRRPAAGANREPARTSRWHHGYRVLVHGKTMTGCVYLPLNIHFCLARADVSLISPSLHS